MSLNPEYQCGAGVYLGLATFLHPLTSSLTHPASHSPVHPSRPSNTLSKHPRSREPTERLNLPLSDSLLFNNRLSLSHRSAQYSASCLPTSLASHVPLSYRPTSSRYFPLTYRPPSFSLSLPPINNLLIPLSSTNFSLPSTHFPVNLSFPLTHC